MAEFVLVPPHLGMLVITIVSCMLAGWLLGTLARDFGLNQAGFFAGLTIGVTCSIYAWWIWPT